MNGVAIPFSYKIGPAGAPRSQKIIVEKAEVNVPADSAVFAFPSAPATGKE